MCWLLWEIWILICWIDRRGEAKHLWLKKRVEQLICSLHTTPKEEEIQITADIEFKFRCYFFTKFQSGYRRRLLQSISAASELCVEVRPQFTITQITALVMFDRPCIFLMQSCRVFLSHHSSPWFDASHLAIFHFLSMNWWQRNCWGVFKHSY